MIKSKISLIGLHGVHPAPAFLMLCFLPIKIQLCSMGPGDICFLFSKNIKNCDSENYHAYLPRASKQIVPLPIGTLQALDKDSMKTNSKDFSFMDML